MPSSDACCHVKRSLLHLKICYISSYQRRWSLIAGSLQNDLILSHALVSMPVLAASR